MNNALHRQSNAWVGRGIVRPLMTVLVLLFCGSAGAGERAQECDIHAGACRKTVGGLDVVFDIRPKPVRSMNDLLFTLSLSSAGEPITDASVTVDLSMPGMRMGENRPVLTHKGNGVYEGAGVIVRCPSGKKVWIAEIAVLRRGETAGTSFVFEVR